MIKFFIAFNFFVFTAHAQSKEAVIDRYITAIGGTEQWLAVENRIDSGYIVEFSRFRMPDSSFTKTIVVRPDKQKFKLYSRQGQPYGSLKYRKAINCYNGKYLWLVQNDKISRMNEEESEAYKNTISFGLPDIFLRDKGAKIEYMGRMNLNGAPYEVLKVKGRYQFFYQLLYFDLKTYLLHCAVGYDTPVKRFSYSKEYKWVDGLFVSTYGEDYVNGELKSVGRTTFLKYNAQVDTSVFDEDTN